jgi:hypothetical protein
MLSFSRVFSIGTSGRSWFSTEAGMQEVAALSVYSDPKVIRAMTLNITVLTPVAIYQSADFRLTDPSDASFIRDESAKTVILRYMSWSGFVTYTGIGSYNRVHLSEMVADWLTGIHAPTMADVAASIQREGTRLIKEVERRNRIRFRHTFTLAGSKII